MSTQQPSTSAAEPAPPPQPTYDDLARMIDHSLLAPDAGDEQLVAGSLVARAYGVNALFVRPTDVEAAVRLLDGSGVKVGSVVGFPHGASTTPVKLYEARDLLRRGAREIDVVINISKMLARQFHYVESEMFQLSETCREQGANVKLIFENAYLTGDLKIVACKIAKRTRMDFAKTSTGFAPTGATLDDLRLMTRHCLPRVQVKASGGIRTLEQALEIRELGCTRIGTSSTGAILDAWKKRLEELQRAARQPPDPAGRS